MHFLRRKVQIPRTNVFHGVKLQLLETDDLVRDMNFTVVVLRDRFHRFKNLYLRIRDGICKVIGVDLLHICAAFWNVQLVHVVLLSLMKIDRFLVQSRKRARVIDLSDDPAFSRGLHDNKIVGADASQRDRVGGIGVVCPMPLISRPMYESALAQELQDLGDVMPSKSLIGFERKFECRALKVIDEDMNVVGIDKPHLRRLVQKIVRVIDNELIERCAGGHKYGNRHSTAASGSADPLPARCDRPRITCKHRHVQAPDIDSQFQSVCRNHSANAALAQSTLDLPALVRQVSAAISNDRFLRDRPLIESLLQVANEDFRDKAAVREYDGWNLPLQKCSGNMFGFLDIRPPDAELSVHNRRVVEENMFFAFTGSIFANEFERNASEFLGKFLRVCYGRGGANELGFAAVKRTDPRHATE